MVPDFEPIAFIGQLYHEHRDPGTRRPRSIPAGRPVAAHDPLAVFADGSVRHDAGEMNASSRGVLPKIVARPRVLLGSG